MNAHAFFFVDGRILHVANPTGAGPQYRAGKRILPPGAAVATQVDEGAETAIVVVSGFIEIMIAGATGYLAAGEFARIPPRTHFAYRNAGNEAAELLIRTAPASSPRPTCRVTIDIAAA